MRRWPIFVAIVFCWAAMFGLAVFQSHSALQDIKARARNEGYWEGYQAGSKAAVELIGRASAPKSPGPAK